MTVTLSRQKFDTVCAMSAPLICTATAVTGEPAVKAAPPACQQLWVKPLQGII